MQHQNPYNNQQQSYNPFLGHQQNQNQQTRQNQQMNQGMNQQHLNQGMNKQMGQQQMNQGMNQQQMNQGMNKQMGQQQMNQGMNQQQQMSQGMNQQKIKNPKTQVPETPQMNDRDFSNDMLATEKYMTTAYSIALNEASHHQLYQDLKNIFNETQDCQRDLYNLMFRKGWYSLEAAQQQKLQQDFQKFMGYTSQIPYHSIQ